MAGALQPKLVDPITGEPAKTTSVTPAPAPSVGGGAAVATEGPTPAATGGPIASAPAAPSNGLGAGTGYINLSRVLGANLGAGAGLKTSADKKAGDELKDRTNDEDSYKWKLNDAVQNSSLGGGLLTDGPQGTADALDSKLAAGGNGLTGSLKGLDFSDKFSRNANSQNMQDLQGLGNGASAGRVLAKDGGVTGQYSPKLSALDALIYGGNAPAETRNAVSGAAANYGSEKANAAEAAKNINKNADAARASADETAAANRKFLTDKAPNYEAGSAQGMALSALLGDPGLAFGAPGPGLESMGGNLAAPTLTAVGNGSVSVGAPQIQQPGEGSQNTHDAAPGVDDALLRQRLRDQRAQQGR